MEHLGSPAALRPGEGTPSPYEEDRPLIITSRNHNNNPMPETEYTFYIKNDGDISPFAFIGNEEQNLKEDDLRQITVDKFEPQMTESQIFFNMKPPKAVQRPIIIDYSD